MYSVGYFHIPASDALGFGFGYYKSNFLSLLDPSHSIKEVSWSIIIPDIYNSTGEKEGFAYLGLGILCMFIYIISIRFYSRAIFSQTHICISQLIINFFILI